MRDFATDHSPLALNTATLGHNLDGHGAGWEPERVIDACAARGFGGIVFWRREIGQRAVEIGERARAAGLEVCGLCRAPFLVGPLADPDPSAVRGDFHAAIDMAADLRAHCLTTVRDAVDLCESIGHPIVTIAVDVYHVWWDLSLERELKRAGRSRIAGYHLCDWLADTQDILLDRGMMGDGVADLRRIRAAVEATGYDGFCEVEIFSARNWWTRPPPEVLDTVVERFRSVC